MTTKDVIAQAKNIARLFHDTYETLAPAYGYETREDTKEFDPNSKNGKLMIAVCDFVIKSYTKDLLQSVMEMAEGMKRSMYSDGYGSAQDPAVAEENGYNDALSDFINNL